MSNNFRHYMKLLLAFQAVLFVFILFILQDRNSTFHYSANETVTLSYFTLPRRPAARLPSADVIPKFELVRIPDNEDMKSTLDRFLRDYKKYCNSQLIPKVSANNLVANESFSSLCPCVPDTLVGRVNVKFKTPEFGELELLHSELSLGGSWAPESCIPRHRVAIVIPFRDRQLHLRTLLAILHPMLQRQMLRYTVFVVEQKEPAVFNKAALMNVAFVKASSFADFDCVIFHDVDMLPEDDRNFYSCSPQPRHVGSHVDKFNYRLPYRIIFGGVTAFRPSDFERVNGFSNLYYGWGGEDDDMFNRILAQNMTIVRFPGAIARYAMIRHSRDAGNPSNVMKHIGWQYRPKHYVEDGLNTLRYKLEAIQPRPLYTWLLVSLPPHPNYFGIS